MAKLNDIERLEIIGELAKGTPNKTLATKYNVNRNTILNIKNDNKVTIEQKYADITKLKESIFLLALDQLYNLLKDKKQQPVVLIRIVQELNNQIRLDQDKPTSISKRDDYSGLSPSEIESKIKSLYIEYHKLKVKNSASVIDCEGGTPPN